MFFFSQDFIYRKNPHTLHSIATRDYINIINFTLNDYIAAWRIEDSIGNEVDVTDLLYPELVHYDSESDTYEIVETKKCSEIFIKDETIKNKVNNYNCFDWNEHKFGGAWEDSNVYYFSLNIYQCEHGENKKCSTSEQIKLISIIIYI